MSQIDSSSFPPEAPPIPVRTPRLASPPIAGDDGSTIDVMVVYTSDRAAGRRGNQRYERAHRAGG